jgi:D-sedoheptulose 7-phosphate isomerase
VVAFVGESLAVFEPIARVVVDVLLAGGRVLTCGNGGSALQAQHLSTELVGRFRTERRPLPSFALTADAGVVTAIANDYGYQQVFARQVRGLGGRGDVLVAFSTSGRSANLVAAIEAAAELGITTVALSGGDGGPIACLADHALVVPFQDTPRIQEGHLLLLHLLADRVDAAFSETEGAMERDFVELYSEEVI